MSVARQSVYILGLLLSLQNTLSVKFPYKILKQPGEIIADRITIALELERGYCPLDLRINKNLLSIDYVEAGAKIDKERERRGSKAKETKFCHYIGTIRNIKNSWVALNICEGFDGLMYDGRGIYTVADDIHSGEIDVSNLDKNNNMKFNCRVDTLTAKREIRPTERLKRDLSDDARYYVKTAIVTDQSYQLPAMWNPNWIRNRIRNIMNVVNARFQVLHIFVSIACIEIWSRDEFDIRTNVRNTWDNFADYVKDYLNLYDVDNVILLSNLNFLKQDENGTSQEILGESTCGEMCDSKPNIIIVRDKVDGSQVEQIATTIVYEIAHSFGVYGHTEEKCECDKGKRRLKWPASSVTSNWSVCAKDLIAKKLKDELHSCLSDEAAENHSDIHCVTYAKKRGLTVWEWIEAIAALIILSIVCIGVCWARSDCVLRCAREGCNEEQQPSYEEVVMTGMRRLPRARSASTTSTTNMDMGA